MISWGFFEFPVTPDELIGGAIVFELRWGWTGKFRNDLLRKGFTEFDTPLIKGIDFPNGALGGDGVFVESDEFSEHLRGEPVG